ncbi:hypothetical protein [Flavonifractor sp. HCP28S3_F3]|uniref:hypothetical protein n=1 Tax=Flavonifractor sp. HCP28S3_F3 TaxID=3438939 RepID=UPI003F8A440E
MEWSKIKTIILLMLVGVNAFLLLLVGMRAGRGALYEDETRQAAIQVLERGGIEFGLEQVPKDIDLPTLTVARDRESEHSMAQTLLGDVTQTGESEVRPSYTSQIGTAEFSMNGSFAVSFVQDRWRCSAGETLSEASQSCLEQIGFTGILDQSVTKDSTTTLTYLQEWEDSPIFSCSVTLVWEDQVLTSMEGSRLAGTVDSSSTQALLSTPTILMRFLSSVSEGGSVCSRIEAMTPGYLTVGSGRSVQLTPVWRILTDTGAYYVDAVTGTVTSES